MTKKANEDDNLIRIHKYTIYVQCDYNESPEEFENHLEEAELGYTVDMFYEKTYKLTQEEFEAFDDKYPHKEADYEKYLGKKK